MICLHAEKHLLHGRQETLLFVMKVEETLGKIGFSVFRQGEGLNFM